MSDSTTILVILAGIIALFLWGRFAVMLVALTTPVALYATGLLTLEQAFAGFGDPVIIFIAGLFVIASGLETTGVTAWLGQWLSRSVGESASRLSLYTMLSVIILTPLLSMSGAVTAFVPVVVLLALRMRQSPSKFLMPLAFASAAGSKLALSGTSKNVLISDASFDAGFGRFGFFEFALAGIPLVLGTLVIIGLFGRRLLPERTPANMPADFGRHAHTLVEQYRLTSDAVQMRVRAGSPLIGQEPARVDLASYGALSIIAVNGGRGGASTKSGKLSEGDMLVVRAPGDVAAMFASDNGLAFQDGSTSDIADTLFNKNSGLAEVVIPPRSKLIGSYMSPGMVTENGDLVVVAIQRHGEGPTRQGEAECVGGVTLQAGDHLLLQGTWQALDKRLAAPDFLVVDSPDLVRRQAVPLGIKSTTMLVIVTAMVVVLAAGIMPPSLGVLIAAMAVIGLGILSVEQVYRAIDWSTVILVAAMMPLSTAMYQTGTAEQLAKLLVGIIGDAGPLALLAGLFLFAAILGQVISNTATALILIPIAVVTASELNVSAQPVLMSLNIGASAAFLTPVATASNLIVMGPGGYRFGDYWRLGLALLILYFVVAVLWVPVVWPFK